MPSVTVLVQLGLVLVVFVLLLLASAAMVYAERKVAALIQQREGPNRVGPLGLLQPFADVIKLMFKEELRPGGADAVLFLLAPVISAAAAFAAFAVVPFGAATTFFGLLEEPLKLQVADVNVAVLVVFAITSMSVYGIVLAGWSSNSKYSLLGGLRSASQMISYELPYGLALASVLVLANSLSLTRIVDAQAGYWFGFIPKWFVFLQPVGFLIFMIGGRRRDQPRAVRLPRSGAGAGRRVSHRVPSMAFAMFFLAEYINMVTVSAVATDLFLGGWHGPFLPGVARMDLVPPQDVGAVVLLHLDAVDAAAVSLRPAHAVRVEAAAAAGRAEPAGDGRGGAVPWALICRSSTCSPPSPWWRRSWSSGSGARSTASCC